MGQAKWMNTRALPHYYEPGHLRALSGWINSSYFFPSQIFLIFYIIHWYNGHCRGAAKIAVEEYGRRKAGRWTDRHSDNKCHALLHCTAKDLTHLKF